MRLIKLLAFIVLLFFLHSCIPHRGFVASSNEPMLLCKKKEFQASAGFRPFKYYYADMAYAITNNLALRVNAAGFINLTNLSGSLLYYKSLPRINYYAGALFNFQSNQAHNNVGNGFGTAYTSYRYSCIYNSPGLVLGINLNKDGDYEHHFIFKTQYNIVNKYEYAYKFEDRYEPFDNEKLIYKIPDFFSFEPSYSMLIRTTRSTLFKIQLGYHFTQKTFTHNYTVGPPGQTFYGINYHFTTEKTQIHPVSLPYNITIGYIFYSKRE